MKELVYHRSLLPAVERYADKVGFIDGDYRATYAEHLDRVARLADALGRELGVSRGDRFAVLALNSHHHMELYHAAFLGAGVINPLNLRLAPRELVYILRDSAARVCFVDADFASVIEGVREEAGIEKVVLVGEGDVAHDVKMDDLINAARPRIPEEPDESDPVVLMYTGGTTGLPKGVLLDQRAEILNMYHIAGQVGSVEDTQVSLHQAPMFHSAAMPWMLGVPAAGGTSTIVPFFEPARVLDVIERDRVTVTIMVPTMIAMMLDHPDFAPERLSSLEQLAYGGSPMPDALLQRLLDTFPDLDLVQGYGMTEASVILTVLGPVEHRAGGDILKSVGRQVRGVLLQIQDPDGNVLKAGETGEVCARGGNYMIEYWNKPDATAEAFRGGWYHTGDAGYLDEDGYLYIVDRVKDMIVSGGENVYSAEVENAIATHPAVAQVAVIGIPHDTWGEAVHAIVVVHEGAEATEDEIITHTREWIGGYKVPRSIEFRTEPLPLSGALKVLKRDLRAPFWEGKERGVQ